MIEAIDKGHDMVFRVLSTLFLLVFAFQVQADLFELAEEKSQRKALYVLAGGFSHHFSDRAGPQKYNETNNNLGLEYEVYFRDRWSYALTGQYIKNSVNNDSALLAAGIKYDWYQGHNWRIQGGVFAGAQNGYPSGGERDKGDFIPVAYPVGFVDYKNVGVFGTCVPKIEESGFCLIGFRLKIPGIPGHQ